MIFFSLSSKEESELRGGIMLSCSEEDFKGDPDVPAFERMGAMPDVRGEGGIGHVQAACNCLYRLFIDGIRISNRTQ